MTRGNQRDLARAKNQKKQQDAQKAKNNSGMNLEQRKQRDADVMREKQQKATDKPSGSS